jgi:hypothetical protein
MKRPMKSALVVVLVAMVAACGGSSTNQDRSSSAGGRSRAACEKLIDHGASLEIKWKVSMQEFSEPQAKAFEADMKKSFEDFKQDASFMPKCQAIAQSEFDCMMKATEWLDYSYCQPAEGTAQGTVQ